MNKFKIVAFTLFILITSSSFVIHKFYIGVFDINFNKPKKAIEISARLFIDDLEKALYKKYNKHIYLTTSDEVKYADIYVTDYFKEKLIIKINNKVQNFEFLLKEKEENVVNCYLKIKNINQVKNIEIINDILVDLFIEQQNLLHLNINSKKQTILFTNTTTKQKINY